MKYQISLKNHVKRQLFFISFDENLLNKYNFDSFLDGFEEHKSLSKWNGYNIDLEVVVETYQDIVDIETVPQDVEQYANKIKELLEIKTYTGCPIKNATFFYKA